MAVDLDALVADALALFEGAEPEIVPVMLGRRQVGVRFLPMSGREWRDLVLRHPPRKDVLQDANVGFHVDEVVAAYPNVALVVGDEVDDMIRTDAEGKKYSKWSAVWDALTATGRKDVSSAIWVAHVVAPEQLVADAGKASPGLRKKKRS